MRAQPSRPAWAAEMGTGPAPIDARGLGLGSTMTESAKPSRARSGRAIPS